MNEYCQTLKVLADQLSNVNAAVDEQDLVLQTLAGLTEQYETVGTILQNTKPLPSFVEVRSQLCMNETTKANQAMHSANKAATALHVHSPSSPAAPSSATPTHSDPMRGRPKTRGRGRGRSSSSQSTRPRSQNNQYPQPNHPYIIFPNNWASTQWANFQNNLNRFSPQQSNPPCPYPSTPRSNTSQGILGPHPAQAHVATYSPTPTDIAQALYTLSMSQPTDPIGYMDTGATGHMEQPVARGYYPARLTFNFSCLDFGGLVNYDARMFTVSYLCMDHGVFTLQQCSLQRSIGEVPDDSNN
ncbi:uncharacterized protein LOC110923785 [Helianthus annuus]|uniref:uncharacterized protein LOC110923785 n=1 Tax=Helianthus annuus TaxID=4232 RepID=UPI000B8FDFB1|nr:uncharacterized protein LOC110923785 [Helianthus annuus]